ncbi:hypothetical protein B0A48_12326 [Cryoendolithus antarcticus]|uniref:Fibronectin type-III domain-containing protein n=1 Tax=Cryoendolithus antarcticus TaxID=1507870 RepID=A0A1V8SRR0_9PEZI|nr:hypothetical protein B0A48_12326 [Cryoendolithus antarcticus]
MAKGQAPITGITHAAASFTSLMPVSASASVPALDGVLLGHIIEVLAAPLAFWFKPVCVCVALFWLCIRASNVLNKPLDELAALLGFDIPLTPTIDLAGIRADGAVIHWSLSEKQKHKSTLKYEVHVNGNIVDSVSFHESAVTITGLQPGSPYVVRVALVNSLEFSSKSLPIRFRTKPAASGDFYRPDHESHEQEPDLSYQNATRVTPFRGLKHISPPSPDLVAPPMARESSTGIPHKKSVSGRRPSPASLGIEGKHDPQHDDNESPEGAESIQQLTERLEIIRHEIEETERLAKEDEEEESQLRESLIEERDSLKTDAADKDKISRNLRRDLNLLERQNTAAQNERNKHETSLRTRQHERQKGREDVVRWQKEAVQLRAEADALDKEKTKTVSDAAAELECLQPKLVERAASCKTLDDGIRELNAEIKKIERATKNESPSHDRDDSNLARQHAYEADEDRMWQETRGQLHAEYARMTQIVDSARAQAMAWSQYVEHLRADRRHQEAASAMVTKEYPTPPASGAIPHRTDSQRSHGLGAHANSNGSPRISHFPPAVAGASYTASAFGPGFQSRPTPYMNLTNGMTINDNPTGGLQVPADELERLTGGAPMSPGAGALLPADLLSGDDDRPTHSLTSIPGLGMTPGQSNILPGLGQPLAHTEYQGPGPASPSSIHSRPASAFASPRGSSNNLHLSSPDHLNDIDTRSIHSTRSGRAFSGLSGNTTASRFSNVFGKSRGKNASMDDAASSLPSLGKVQSQSMPRHDQHLAGIDSAARKRNSSISGAVFGGALSHLSGEGHTVGLMDGSTAEPGGASRRRQFNLNPFSKDKIIDGWPSSFAFGRRPASPRPGSTHSTELPRPSFDSSRWGVDTWPTNDAARSSPLSFGAWNSTTGGAPSRLFGSRHPSRRPSVQHGASGPPEDIMEDEDSDALDPDEESHLAPIGTKPSPAKSKAEVPAPKLNPNAKDFRSFLSSMKLGGKDRAKPSAPDSDASSAKLDTTLTNTEDDGNSPPTSRKSRDTRSLTTTESSFADTHSARESSDLARTPSYTDASITNSSPVIGAGGSVGKESFMAKLTRKSSSGGKFSLPTFKRDKSRLGDNGMTTPTGTGSPRLGWGMEETDAESEGLGASVSSLRDGRSSISGRWSTVLKLGKKEKGKVESGAGEESEEGSVGGER